MITCWVIKRLVTTPKTLQQFCPSLYPASIMKITMIYLSGDVIELLIYHQPGVKPSLTLHPFGVLGYVAGHSLTISSHCYEMKYPCSIMKITMIYPASIMISQWNIQPILWYCNDISSQYYENCNDISSHCYEMKYPGSIMKIAMISIGIVTGFGTCMGQYQGHTGVWVQIGILLPVSFKTSPKTAKMVENWVRYD